jgi:hypothetical protein
MKFPITSLACGLALVLSAAVQAQIYESTDSQGNPVFTDTPTSGAEKVDVPQENIGDSVDIPPPAPNAAARPSQPHSAEEPDKAVVIHDSRNEQLEDELAEGRRHEVLDAESRHEVLDAEPRHEVLDGEKRHEVGD